MQPPDYLVFSGSDKYHVSYYTIMDLFPLIIRDMCTARGMIGVFDRLDLSLARISHQVMR